MKKLLLPLVMSLMTITSQAQTYHLDTNNDGSIELTDALIIINYILGKFNPEGDNSRAYLTCPDDHHPHLIDLGLPSGTNWACCNIGATTPESYGGYYAWGETEEKDTYTWSNYIHCDGSQETCHDLGSDIASTQYDVAHVKWGGSWVMPSREQIDELLSNCTFEWTTMSGVNGEKFTSKANGGSIFLPAAGFHVSSFFFAGDNGNCWSSTQDPLNAGDAIYLKFNSDESGTDGYYGRHYGRSVRPVTNKAKTKTYHFDVNNDGEIELTDALIIINYILGKFVPEGEWYMVAKTSDSDTELVPVKEVGSLVAVDDALDFTILGINGDVILENVVRVDFKPQKDLDSTEVALLANRQASIPAKVKGVKKAAQGQCTFVVADRKGSNNLIQGLTFQHDNKGSSWTGDGLSGSIRDLQYIARTRTELATASGDDIIKMLEELSGTDQADAQAMAATASMNANVEEATSEDGANVVLKMKGSNSHVVYPLYEDASIFSEDALQETYANTMRAIKKGRHIGTTYRGKVAIFNHFQGMSNYSNQNRIVSYIKVMFELNGYDVEYYGKYADPEHMGNIDYDQKFDAHNLSEVTRHSDEYKAILIFSHGFEFGGKSYFATSEVVEKETEYCIHHNLDIENGVYYNALPVEGLTTNNKCITYLGSCFGAPKEGYGDGSFLDQKGSCFLAWNGKNRVAQADAMMLFYDMIYEGLSLEYAVLYGYKKDPWNKGSERLSYNVANHELEGEESLKPNYVKGKSLLLKNIEDFYLKTEYETVWELTGEALGTWHWPTFVKIKMEPMMAARPDLDYEEFYGPFSEGKFVSHITMGKDLEENIYKLSAYSLDEKNNWQPVRFANPYFYIYSLNLSDNYALPRSSEEDMKTPSILGTDGQPVKEISLSAGTSQTYQVDAYPGHTLETPCLNTDVATVSLSGNTLTVTGVSVDSTYFGVYDKQNHQLAVVKVTVTEGADQPSYLACPDDHHPHLIDLGLPSGTKWACCNVGATTPESYGGYYAWGETEEKDYYDWSTYIHCDGSAGTCHDLGSDIAGTQYDVAHVKWGGSWVMPSYDQQTELRENCSSEWTTVNGINGRVFTGPSGASIFLPAAGYRWYDGPYYAGSYGYYWSSTQYPSDSYIAYSLGFYSGGVDWDYDSRSNGLSVRPVSR